ncbi:MAG: histidine--tRNA ligase [Candidatus Vogelbacteria bacterium CG10_big_fil_rev_8_21_14_0_10_51_16]|uniref:Histidine--tRNA ligase n=1 Tax=Candidatus Vogelbacteria bacterium CG10_big_fil_rev_8_21_14_0_10_51_16 TaxID=1975045 RepID=A0A2H0RDL2_9BACT|nr:MAG: histidine--tRNA ligase [Candidatus Vogelbacteria bacterium CG10_big_fil_rev_8_21_14_0_10_51_16]
MITNIRGTRDLYPEEMRRRKAFLAAARGVLDTACYDEYDAPLLEKFELYTAKSSAEIIERQSYVFEDRGGERLVLRPEMTPSLARMVAARRKQLPSLLRWYSLPECWRYERPQKGRTRNFLQLNVDLLGSDDIRADVEIIDVAFRLLVAWGVDVGKVEARVNDRRVLTSLLAVLGAPPERGREIMRLLDEREKLELSEFSRRLRELGVDDAGEARLAKFLAGDDLLLQSADAERVRTLVAKLGELGWRVRFDPTLIRGFDYYTSTVFELFDTSGEFSRAIFGGGRYDNLVADMGAEPMPVIGFGVSDVAIETLLKDQERELPFIADERWWVIPFSVSEVAGADSVATILRAQGKPASVALPPYDMKRQLKRAAQEGVAKTVLVMPEEWARGEVIVRDMEKGAQQTVKLETLVPSTSLRQTV